MSGECSHEREFRLAGSSDRMSAIAAVEGHHCVRFCAGQVADVGDGNDGFAVIRRDDQRADEIVEGRIVEVVGVVAVR